MEQALYQNHFKNNGRFESENALASCSGRIPKLALPNIIYDLLTAFVMFNKI